MNLWQRIVEVQASGGKAVLATVVEASGSAPREVGAKMLVFEDGAPEGTIGGGAIEKAVIEECMAAMRDRRPKLLEYELTELQMSCGGRVKIFIEPLFSAPPLIIFGAGHVGKAMAAVADLLGFRVTIVDNRPEFANPRRFPNAEKIAAKEYSAALTELEFTPETCLVIATHQHIHDREILEYCVRQPFAYLGMIGSRTKVQQTFKALEEAGIDRAALQRVHSPMGLAIGARTPEEIAVSVAAEMIAVRYGVDVSALSMRLQND
ncbi:MAG: xanthine dehydrogenase accessory protein XdhC [candidate division KSB1 bacterium]|nr:xanthine dehydrogenase accessory protein XdhC [candidate division KSB1 bacterium]